MSKVRSPNREKAFEIYKKYKGKITYKKIAELLNEKERNIKYWKFSDDWIGKYNPLGGAPKGNKNAVGHGAPTENQNARKFGWYSKYLPVQSINIIKELEESNASALDILWAQITTQFAAIVRAQKIMFVRDHDDTTKELKKIKTQSDNLGTKSNPNIVEIYQEKEYELQFAWDKQATFLNAQSRAMSELRSSIRQYEEMLKDGFATEEQKLRIEKLKVSINGIKKDIQIRKDIAEKKLQLEHERLKHQEKVDELKNF